MFGKDMNGMMQKMQQLQKDVEVAQKEINAHTEEGKSGGGMVKVVLNGADEIEDLLIDDSLLTKDSKEILSDLIIAAHREAKSKIKKYSSTKMQGLTGGLPLNI